jgi:hypothetical protein
MKAATCDRGAVLHFAGRHGLSPALRGATPAFAREKEEGLERCGWERFFAALDRAGPALVIDDGDPASALPAPSADRHRGALAAGVGRARRFLAALRSPPPAG